MAKPVEENYLITIKGTMEQNGENDTVEPDDPRQLCTAAATATTSCMLKPKPPVTPDVHHGARQPGMPGWSAMTRFGKTSSQLIIEKGIRHLCHYETGYGSISLGVAADVIEHNLLPDGGELQFSYTLDSGAETLISRNSVLITVEPLKKQETEVE